MAICSYSRNTVSLATQESHPMGSQLTFIAECQRTCYMPCHLWKIRTAIFKCGNARDLLWETQFLHLTGLGKGIRNLKKKKNYIKPVN